MTTSETEFPCLRCDGEGMLKAGDLSDSGRLYRPCSTCQPVAAARFGVKAAVPEEVSRVLGTPVPQRYVAKIERRRWIILDRKKGAEVPGVLNEGRLAIRRARQMNQRAAAEK